MFNFIKKNVISRLIKENLKFKKSQVIIYTGVIDN